MAGEADRAQDGIEVRNDQPGRAGDVAKNTGARVKTAFVDEFVQFRCHSWLFYNGFDGG
jgi:hypothetical protein